MTRTVSVDRAVGGATGLQIRLNFCSRGWLFYSGVWKSPENTDKAARGNQDTGQHKNRNSLIAEEG